MSERLFDRRGYVILTLAVGDRRECTGYGIEILDCQGGQNEAGRNGRIYFALGQDQPDPSRAAEPFIETYPGNRDMVRFDRILYVNGPTTAFVEGSNPVRVKVFTEPKVAFVDSEPAGVPRVRHLVRSDPGGVVLAANGSAGDVETIYENLGQLEDRFHEDPRFDERMYWYGVVIGTRSFEVYSETKPSAFDATRQWAQRMVATDYATAGNVAARMVAAEPGVQQGFIMDFTVGASQLTRNAANTRIVYPLGQVALHVLNTDAAGTNTIRYVVGVVGHT